MKPVVFPPLASDHPLVIDQTLCPFCMAPFLPNQRIMLAFVQVDVETPSLIRTVPAHATCALQDISTPVGKITRIKDGDASPFPVITEDGTQHTLAEAGLAGD